MFWKHLLDVLKYLVRCFDNLKHLPVTDPPFLSILTSHRRLPLFVFFEGSARSFVEEAGSGCKLIASRYRRHAQVQMRGTQAHVVWHVRLVQRRVMCVSTKTRELKRASMSLSVYAYTSSSSPHSQASYTRSSSSHAQASYTKSLRPHTRGA